MAKQNDTTPPEIYDMSVNNPLAQSFLEKSAFLKFLIQQLKSMLTPSGEILGELAKYNNFVNQIERVREEVMAVKHDIRTKVEMFKTNLEEINQRRRHISMLIMQLTREKSAGSIDQDSYHRKKYEFEMKRKSLGNQILILNKNISIYNNLLNTPVPMDSFEIVEELDTLEEIEQGGQNEDDEEMLLEQSADGITYMGVLSSDLEKAIFEKKQKDVHMQEAGAASGSSEKDNLKPRLNIITETGKQYFYSLSPTRVIHIGRSSQNDIQIPSPAVSRNHAEIVFQDGDFYVVDMESSNGTFVNDKMVIRRKLEPNDTVSIGGTRLIFLI